MTKAFLDNAVSDNMTTTHDALNTIWTELNRGQQQKLLKNAKIAELLKRYRVVE